MTEKTKTKFEQYALLKMQVHALEYKIEELKKVLIPYVEKAEDMKIQEEYGTFFMKEGVKYEYSKTLVKKEAQIKELKQEEQKSGKAKKIVTPQFVFTPARLTVPAGAYEALADK